MKRFVRGDVDGFFGLFVAGDRILSEKKGEIESQEALSAKS
jgi:hypothetical protein